MKRLLFSMLVFAGVMAHAQVTVKADTVKPGRFDQGKMWTFESLPTGYFEETYGFKPTQEWLDDVRQSALRFATWCSASFISENGLILTNHHCSQSVAPSVQREGEDFAGEGFVAKSMADERKIKDLFVDQLVRLTDITAKVTEYAKGSTVNEAIEKIKAEYATIDGWKDLVIQHVTFYSGSKYSLYGFKRYTDIRLVLYPEEQLGYYGGDPDNFTYPRYNLDFTLFRAYDENGEPLKPRNFFKFNPNGAGENELVFVVGNPGSTGRYLTMAQLYFMRDVQVPAVLDYLQNRVKVLDKYKDTISDFHKRDSVRSMVFSLGNANKAWTGRLDGMRDAYLMAKKENKEKQVRANSPAEKDDPWNKIEANMAEMKQVFADNYILSPAPQRGRILGLMHDLYNYSEALKADKTEDAAKLVAAINRKLKGFDRNLERALLAVEIEELRAHSKSAFVKEVFGTKAPYDAAGDFIASSKLFDPKNMDKLLKLKADKFAAEKDPLLTASNKVIAAQKQAQAKVAQLNRDNQQWQERVVKAQFALSGTDSPPDASFSLRFADGIVKRFEYNGTIAPYKTTYYGLYDRYYSNDMEFPWSLPEKWKNPPAELLKAPLNFVSTNDIIGGNSGSAIINKNKEVVGLVFDGNIESLPGYFIYDSRYNRTVSVHAGGISAAIKYIYKADWLLKELNAE
jgi:hypothetical protein